MSNILDDKDAMQFFMEASLTGDPSKAIENQEKRGQMTEAKRQTLPRDMQNVTQEQMESLGFVFGEQADDLFVYVTFPNGWKKEPTSHSMHTDIVDDKGRRRGGIFYKAAFYDRSAHMYLSVRYSYGTQPVDGWINHDPNEDRKVAYVDDCGTRIFESEPVEIGRGEYEKKQELEQLAKQWIEEHFPLHNDPTAYWD